MFCAEGLVGQLCFGWKMGKILEEAGYIFWMFEPRDEYKVLTPGTISIWSLWMKWKRKLLFCFDFVSFRLTLNVFLGFTLILPGYNYSIPGLIVWKNLHKTRTQMVISWALKLISQALYIISQALRLYSRAWNIEELAQNENTNGRAICDFQCDLV